jgi:SAM-dependent methyltransferase
MDDKVRAQYEAYPYPARDPRDEKTRLITGSPSNLAEINHYLFAGRRDFARPFRALVAGGGTGDAAIMLAQQLADAGQAGEVVYLDVSAAARRIAEARAEARGLANISFLTGSLLDLPEMRSPPFDYIDCCGVLHHLADPLAGLRTLTADLAEGGGLGLMVYGAYGRRGVYETQEMLRALGTEAPLADQVARARRLLAALPETNWLKLNPFLGDHRLSDAELVDLLLHPRDRAFRVAEVAALLGDAGLRLASFIEPARYDPASYLKDPRLLKPLAGLAPLARAAFAEALAGNLKTHVFYATTAPGDSVARPDDPAAVPVLRELEGADLAKAVGRELLLKTSFDGLALRFALPRLAPAILARVDGAASLGEIHAGLKAMDSMLDWDRFKTQFDQLYAALNGINHLLLAYPPSPTSAIQGRFQKI